MASFAISGQAVSASSLDGAGAAGARSSTLNCSPSIVAATGGVFVQPRPFRAISNGSISASSRDFAAPGTGAISSGINCTPSIVSASGGVASSFFMWPVILADQVLGWSPILPAPPPIPSPPSSGTRMIPALGIRANGQLFPLVVPASKLPVLGLNAAGELIALIGVTSRPPAVALRASGELVPLL